MSSKQGATNGGWQLVNLTALPTERLRELIEFARGWFAAEGVVVIVRYPDPKTESVVLTGYFLAAYRAVGRTPSMLSLRISRRMTATGTEVEYRGRFASVGTWQVMRWPEAILSLAAHEWAHHRQHRHWRGHRLEPRRLPTRRRPFREPAAEQYALRRLMAWRAAA